MTPSRVILALGLFRPIVDGVERDRGIEGIIAEVRKSFPHEHLKVLTILDFTDFDQDFQALTTELTDEQQRGVFRGIGSGFFVQGALAGAHGITDIHFDLTGVDSVTVPGHASSELRSLLAHLRAESDRKVNIHFKTERGVASFPRDRDEVVGAPLPAFLRRYLTPALFPRADE